MLPRAVLFDLDGTLIDTLDDITILLGRALVSKGFAAPDRSAVATMVGDGARALVARAVGRSVDDPEVATLTDAYVAAYEADPTPATKPNPGAVAFLDALVVSGVPAIVVTNKMGPVARVVVERMFGNRVRAVLGAGDTERLKPHPEPLLAALRLVSVEPRDAWMIGDGSQDIEAARAAGIRAIAFSGGYGRPVAADQTIADFRELL